MHQTIALPVARLSFGSRHRNAVALATLRQTVRRWLARARIDAIAAALCDLKFNPFLFQIESGR